jgi:hypothetical protein
LQELRAAAVCRYLGAPHRDIRVLDLRASRTYIYGARPSSDPASPHCRFRLSAVFSFLDGLLRAVVHAHYSLSEEADMAPGTVKWFNDDKGFGFIKPDDGGKDRLRAFLGDPGHGTSSPAGRPRRSRST